MDPVPVSSVIDSNLRSTKHVNEETQHDYIVMLPNEDCERTTEKETSCVE